jgi:hypothetical protein
MANHRMSFEKFGNSFADTSLTMLENSWENLRQLSKDFESDENSSRVPLNSSTGSGLATRLAGTTLSSTGRKRKKTTKGDLITSFQQTSNVSDRQEDLPFQIYSDSSDDEKAPKKPANVSRLHNDKDDVYVKRLVQNLTAKGKITF